MTKKNRVAFFGLQLIAIVVVIWFTLTLYFSYRVEKSCKQVINRLQNQSSILKFYAYDYRRNWFDSTFKFNLAAKFPLGGNIKLYCEGKAIHGPLVVDWVRCWPTTAIINLHVYYLDAKTEERLAYLGDLKAKISFDGKLKILDWRRTNQIKLANGSFSWRNLGINVLYMPDGRSFAGIQLNTDWLQIVNRHRMWQLTGLNIAWMQQTNHKTSWQLLADSLQEYKYRSDTATLTQRFNLSEIKLIYLDTKSQTATPINASYVANVADAKSNTYFDHQWSLTIKHIAWHTWQLDNLDVLVTNCYQYHDVAAMSLISSVLDKFYMAIIKNNKSSKISLLDASNNFATNMRNTWQITLKRCNLDTALGPISLQAVLSYNNTLINLAWLPLFDCQLVGELSFSKKIAHYLLKTYPELKEETLGQQLCLQLKNEKMQNTREQLNLRWNLQNGHLNYQII